MSNDTGFLLDFCHSEKSYLIDVKVYLEQKKKRWKEFENSNIPVSELMVKLGVEYPNELVSWGFDFDEILKSEDGFVLSAHTWANQNASNTHISGEDGELADLLRKFPELIIKGTYRDEYGSGRVTQYEQIEERTREEEDDDDDEEDEE